MKPRAFNFDEAFGEEEDEDTFEQQSMEVDGGYSLKASGFGQR